MGAQEEREIAMPKKIMEKVKKIGKGIVKEFSKNPRQEPLPQARREADKRKKA